jgi:hypothetical protein
LIAWNLETGYIKYYLHELDPTCMSKSGGNHILESKSVDCIIILYKKSMIVSVTADQKIRFWDFDVTSGKQPVFTLYGDHDKLDSLTAVATDEDNDYILTGDTAGCIKLWDITGHKFRTDLTSENMKEVWFIQAHRRSAINSIQVVPIKHSDDSYEKFIVTCANDHNIQLHRLIDGVHIGQFGQDSMWNIHDLTAFRGRYPNFTRSWALKLKNRRREARAQRKRGGGVGFAAGTKGEESPSPSPVRNQGMSYEDEKEGGVYSDEVSSDEEDGKGITIKGAAQYMNYKPQDKKNERKNNNFIEEYYKKI